MGGLSHGGSPFYGYRKKTVPNGATRALKQSYKEPVPNEKQSLANGIWSELPFRYDHPILPILLQNSRLYCEIRKFMT